MYEGVMGERAKGLGVGATRGLRSAGFALAVAGMALFAIGSAVATARSRAVPTLQTMISPQYQAKMPFGVVGAGPHGFIAGPSRSGADGVAAAADLSKPGKWYHSVFVRYQLPKRIAVSRPRENGAYRTLSARSTGLDTAPHKAIPIVGAGLDQKDLRLLFRLGLALAAAYAVFLGVWLWRTRVRPHDRRRAVRY